MVSFGPDEAFRLMAASPLLSELPPHEIRSLVPHVHTERHSSGANIFESDSPGSCVYWIAEGRVSITTSSPNGHKLLHETLDHGDHFGEITAIDGGTRGVTATADRPTLTLALERDDLLPVLARHSGAMLNLARLLCDRIRVAGDTIRNLALNNAEARIWTRLIQLSKRDGTAGSADGSIRIDHGLSQQSLAASVGLTRVKVNRQLSGWRDAGLLTYGRGFIDIPDPEALRAHVWDKTPIPEDPVD